MIRWRLGNTTFTVEFSFFAVAEVAALWGGGRYVLLLFLAGLLHELGHLAAMGLFHRSVRSVALCGAGTLFTPAEQYGAYWQDIVVSLSGPAVNLVLGGIFLSLDRTSAFGMLHLGLGLFNLLPYANLDGGAVCGSILSICGVLPDQKRRVQNRVSVVISLLLAAVCWCTAVWNWSLLLGIGYLLLMQFWTEK